MVVLLFRLIGVMEMFLKTKDGISCDVCGTIYKDNFAYYSFESTLIAVDSKNLAVQQHHKDLDLDVCEKCYLNAESKVKKNISKVVVPNTIKCDFCPTILKGSFNYHRMLIHRVLVDSSQKDPKGTLIPTVNKNFMDFNADDQCFKQLVNLAMETRESVKSKGDWS